MASPSGGSPGNSTTRESRSGRFSSIPSPTQRLGIASHRNSVPSRGSSTRFSWTTRPRRPNSGTPPAQVFRRLRDEHDYCGGYAQVQRYLLKHRRREQETFIPLGHLPGQRLEADFGHIHVDFPDGRRLVPFLVTTWAYSNYPFVLALPFERTEAILEGMVQAFEFFGAVFPRKSGGTTPKRSLP